MISFNTFEEDKCKDLYFSALELASFLEREFINVKMQRKEHNVTFNSSEFATSSAINLYALLDPEDDFPYQFDIAFIDLYGNPIMVTSKSKKFTKIMLDNLSYDILIHVFP